MKNYYVNFVKQKTIEIECEERSIEDLAPECIAGHTVFSMISAGSEINASYLDVFDWGYPRKSGYTVIFRVEYVGSEVKGISVGDYVFCMEGHQSFQIVDYREAVKIPEGVLTYDGKDYQMLPGDVSLCNIGHSHGFLATEDSLLIVVG